MKAGYMSDRERKISPVIRHPATRKLASDLLFREP
jgi:hypothetical protein